MIELYSGTPGSGKSLHMARDIRNRLKRNDRFIIGNFYVNTANVKRRKGNYIYVGNDKLKPERLLQFSRNLSRHLGRRLKEGEILLIIDEAQLLFNSREWQNLSRSGWLSFFSQHRHYGYDVILAAQFDRMLDRQVRSLIEYEVIHRKVSRFGNLGFVIGMLCGGGNLFVSVRKWYPVKERIEAEFFIGTKRAFCIYDSYNHFDAPGQSTRTSGDLRGPTNKRALPANRNNEDGKSENAPAAPLPVIEIKPPEVV